MIKFYSNFEQDEKIGYNYDKEEIKLAENEVIQSLKEIKYNVSQFEKNDRNIKEVKGFNVVK